MMEIFIYSDDEGIHDLFRGISKSKRYTTTFLPRESLDDGSSFGTDERLIYFDISGYNRRKIQHSLQKLVSTNCAWAIIDPQNAVEDPAELFHMGACDYLPPLCLTDRVRAARIHRVAEYRNGFTSIEKKQPPAKEGWIIPSGTDWSSIKNGKEYSFYFLYIELIPSEEWRVKSGEKNRKFIQSKFEQVVRKRIASAQGMIWMWSGWGGVVLFPFSRDNSQPVIIATRFVLNRPFISIEDMEVETLVDYRLALHVGNTVYNPRGETGEIIADDINFIFHLGKKRMKENSLYVTETAYPQIPQKMRFLFLKKEDFEGRNLYRMRRFLF